MAALTSALRPAPPNRRRRVRHKIQTPAYASFAAGSKSSMLDLHEIVDISEDGIAIQCHSPLAAENHINLCLDLAECEGQIFTTAQVVWVNSSGRAGLRFSDLPPASLFRLREWFFLNVMAGVANGDVVAPLAPEPVARPNYTDTLAAVTAVQGEVEALGPDLVAALQLIASRAQSMVRASGVAIALATADPGVMLSRASSGPSAPPVDVQLQVGSGFSGECVRAGRLLRCDDTELDPTVDREICRALGIRSILAVPVRAGEKSVGLLEAFSALPNAFAEADSVVLQRLADTTLAAVNRAAQAENLPAVGDGAATFEATRFGPALGSVLFASEPAKVQKPAIAETKNASGITLPRSHLLILVCAAAIVFLALGYNLAPWIQSKIPQRGGNLPLQTVLASSRPPAPETSATSVGPAIETATFAQLHEMAEKGDPAAENAVGLRYFQGDDKNGIPQDEKEAFIWFERAANLGNLPAQSKLAFLYWSGRGVPKDLNRAYFWTVLARARGDQGNKDLAALLASRMTRNQTAEIEQQANLWLQQHAQTVKPAAGH
jgi:TPR repeat protein